MKATTITEGETMATLTQRITPFLWFDDRAEDAARFYVAIFENSRIHTTTHYDAASAGAAGRPAGSVMTVVFDLAGQRFVALNGGPHFTFTEAVSFVVNCETQKEIDHYWDKLSAGGKVQQCGWLKDKYGLSWQVVPKKMVEWFGEPNEKSERLMTALLQMRKLDIAALEKAYEGR